MNSSISAGHLHKQLSRMSDLYATNQRIQSAASPLYREPSAPLIPKPSSHDIQSSINIDGRQGNFGTVHGSTHFGTGSMNIHAPTYDHDQYRDHDHNQPEDDDFARRYNGKRIRDDQYLSRIHMNEEHELPPPRLSRPPRPNEYYRGSEGYRDNRPRYYDQDDSNYNSYSASSSSVYIPRRSPSPHRYQRNPLYDIDNELRDRGDHEYERYTRPSMTRTPRHLPPPDERFYGSMNTDPGINESSSRNIGRSRSRMQHLSFDSEFDAHRMYRENQDFQFRSPRPPRHDPEYRGPPPPPPLPNHLQHTAVDERKNYFLTESEPIRIPDHIDTNPYRITASQPPPPLPPPRPLPSPFLYSPIPSASRSSSSSNPALDTRVTATPQDIYENESKMYFPMVSIKRPGWMFESISFAHIHHLHNIIRGLLDTPQSSWHRLKDQIKIIVLPRLEIKHIQVLVQYLYHNSSSVSRMIIIAKKKDSYQHSKLKYSYNAFYIDKKRNITIVFNTDHQVFETQKICSIAVKGAFENESIESRLIQETLYQSSHIEQASNFIQLVNQAAIDSELEQGVNILNAGLAILLWMDRIFRSSLLLNDDDDNNNNKSIQLNDVLFVSYQQTYDNQLVRSILESAVHNDPLNLFKNKRAFENHMKIVLNNMANMSVNTSDGTVPLHSYRHPLSRNSRDIINSTDNETSSSNINNNNNNNSTSI